MTNEEFCERLSIVQPNLIPNDKYVNNRTKYHCICKIHNCDVNSTPYKMLHKNQGCKICASERSPYANRYTHDDYCAKVESLNPNILIVSKYLGAKNRIEAECKICGYNWNPIAESLVRNTERCGCPKCSGNAILTNEEFKKFMEENCSTITLLSDYERSNKKIHVSCNECNNDFWITPNKLQQGQRCSCHSESYGEAKIKEVLNKYDIDYIYQKKFDDLFGISNRRKLSYDFYLPSYNVLIEYNGEQHEKPVRFSNDMSAEMANQKLYKQKQHDKMKQEYAIKHDIKLVTIWYYSFNEIEKIISDECLKLIS